MESKQPGPDKEHWSILSDHPLSIELSSLRGALAHYQNAAHSASIQLQGRSLETSLADERCRRLEEAKSALEAELALLRAYSYPTQPSPATTLAELTLALRRLNIRLTNTELSLKDRIREGREYLVDRYRAQEEAARLRREVEVLREKEKKISSREAAMVAKEKELAEERRLVDEVANSINSQPTSGVSTPSELVFDTDELSSTTKPPPYSFPQTRNAIVKLMREASAHSTRLEAQLAETISMSEVRDSEVKAERNAVKHETERAARAEAALDVAQADDRAAAGLVDRYMKFSQSTTDALHNTLSILQKRHMASQSTLQSQIAQITSLANLERARGDSFRRALNEVTQDVLVHAEGRRREIAVRLSLIAREEKWVGELRKWVGGATRQLRKLREAESPEHPAIIALENVIQSASDLLARVDGSHVPPDVESEVGLSEGSVGRIIAAEEAVTSLITELQDETQLRLQLEKNAAEREAALQETFVSNGHADLREVENEDGVGISASNPESGVDGASANGIQEGYAIALDRQESNKEKPAVTDGQVDGFSGLGEGLQPSDIPTESGPTTEETGPSTHTVRNSPSATTAAPIVDIGNGSSLPTKYIIGNEDSTIYTGDEDSRVMSPGDVSMTAFSSLTRVDSDISLFNRIESSAALTDAPGAEPADPPPARDPELDDLLERLTSVTSRYDGMQQSFKACHLALSELEAELVTLAVSPSPNLVPQDGISLLSIAVHRLDDITEDTRVSLEIKIIDDARIAKGFETLLSIGGSRQDRQRLIENVTEFIAGEQGKGPPSTVGFEKKLDDIEHDVAVIKSVVHEWIERSDSSSPLQGSRADVSSPPIGWGWTSNFLPSRPSTPSLPTPTFGTVMSGALSLKAKQSASSLRLPGSSSPTLDPNPLATLGLRHIIPIHTSQSNQALPTVFPQSRRGSAQLGLGLPVDRPGTPSAYFAPHFGHLGSSPVRQEVAQRGPLRVVSAPHLSIADDIE